MYGAPPAAYDPSMGAPPAPQGVYDPSMGAPPMGPPMGGPPMGAPPMGQPQMMGPPMGYPGYDPQGQALLQAETDLATLEQQKQARDEKEKQKDVDHLTHMMRSNQRDQEDNRGCANMLVFWGILNALLWALPLLGDSWWNKIWHGMSVDKLTVQVGLFNMEVHVECKDNLVGEMALCYAMKKYGDHNGGHWAVLEIQEQMCKDYKPSCSVMERLYTAGFAPLGLLPAAAAFEVLGVLLLYFYWNGKPTSLVRGLANKCSVMAPISGMMGFACWMMISPYLIELPRFWAAEAGHKEFANGAVLGFKESFSLQAGWCCLLLFFNVILSSIRFFCQFTMALHIDEPDPYGFDESTRLVQEAEKMYDGKA